MKEQNLSLKDENVFNEYLESSIQKLKIIISNLETEIFYLIYNNISEEKMNGSIDVPIVKSETSDFQILKNQKSRICQEIRNIQKQITLSSILDNDMLEKLNNKKKKLEDELSFINSNPKKYLRYQEAKSFDYSNVEDDRIRVIIKCKLDELSLFNKEYEKLSKINCFQGKDIKVKKYKSTDF